MGIANGGGWSGSAAKACDSCKAAASSVFCRADTAFLCLSCDAKIHDNRTMMAATSRHERVWVCDVCEQAPAAVTCKADAACLCVSCDADIHSANPLAQRHDRIPVEPFFDSAADSLIRSSAVSFFSPAGACNDNEYDGACPHHHQNRVVETSNWNILSNAGNKVIDGTDMKSSGEIFFSEMDSFLDVLDYNSNPIHPSSGTDSVVPVKIKPTSISPSPMINQSENCFDIDFSRSKLSSFTNYPSQCLSHSVSSSSQDVGVVPDGKSISEISYSFGRNLSQNSIGGGDPIPSVPASSTSTSASQATQLCGMDREARVLRYREKRKNRKFEKTIRYASRKAYAETRPRIKGRFAKRTEIEIDAGVDQIYGGSAFFAAADSQYGVVPTFQDKT